METMAVHTQPKPAPSAAVAIDLRAYIGDGAHAGQAFSIDGAFGNVGEGRFTVVSASHVEVACTRIDAFFHKGSGHITLKDGEATIALKDPNGNPGLTLKGTYTVERYWLNLDLKGAALPIRVQMWRSGRNTDVQSGITKYWLAPKAIVADAEEPALPGFDLRNYLGEGAHSGQRFNVWGLTVRGPGQIELLEPRRLKLAGEIEGRDGKKKISVHLALGIAVVTLDGKPMIGAYAPDLSVPVLRIELFTSAGRLSFKVFRAGTRTIIGGNTIGAVVLSPAGDEATTDMLLQLCDAE